MVQAVNVVLHPVLLLLVYFPLLFDDRQQRCLDSGNSDFITLHIAANDHPAPLAAGKPNST